MCFVENGDDPAPASSSPVAGNHIDLQTLNGHGKRRSTIEVHPKFSEAPHLRSSSTSPEYRLQLKSNCIPMNNPMAQVYQNVFFRNKIGIATILS